MQSEKSQRVFVAGHNGMVGSALKRKLESDGRFEVILKDRSELDLMDQLAVYSFFEKENIDLIYLAAARVGGIHANNERPAEFIHENLAIQNNVVHGAHLADVQNLLFLGSSCIYPKFVEQPITEAALMSGKLEPTNEPYAIAKIAGIKMCESYNRQYGRDYRSVMPTNLYGVGDNFHSIDSHVIPALIRRFYEAKSMGHPSVMIWGTGKARREFLHVDDLADACLHVMNIEKQIYESQCDSMESHINVGTGQDCSIAELAELIRQISGYSGSIEYDHTKPDGTPRKLIDVSLLSDMGWNSSIALDDGLVSTWNWFTDNIDIARLT